MIGLTLRLALALLLARPARPGRRRPRPDTGPLRLAAVNAPRWTPKKRWVVSAVVQALRLRRLLNRLKVDIATIAESYPAQRVVLRRSRRWGVFASTPNPGGPGQAIVHRRSPRSQRVRRTSARTVATPFARYANSGGLHMGAGTYRRGPHELAVGAIHLPRPGDDGSNQWADQVRKVRDSLPDTGGAAIAGDINRGAEDVRRVLGDGWRIAADADVMTIFVRDCEIKTRSTFTRGYRWLVSDHTAVPYVDLIPEPRKATR